MKEKEEQPDDMESRFKKNDEKQAELRRRIETIRKETYDWLKSDPEVAAFLEPYNSFMHESFFIEYSHGKAIWKGLRDYYKEQLAQNELELMEIARHGFTCLLQAKLVAIRREWGAGLVDIPGIRSPFDFIPLADDVFSVSWLPSIDEEEFRVLIDFVMQHQGYDLSFQFDYEAREFSMPLFLEEGEDNAREHSLASWYAEKMSTDRLNVLPDKKGELAQKYIILQAQKEKEEQDAKIARGELPPEKELDTKPFPPSKKVWFIEKFIKRFEDRETLNDFRTYQTYKTKYENAEDECEMDTVAGKAKDILRRLEHIDVVLPVKSNADWRVALIESWDEYRRNSIAGALKQAYDDYLFHVQTGIAYHTGEVKDTTQKRLDTLKEKYRKGVALSGDEPPYEV